MLLSHSPLFFFCLVFSLMLSPQRSDALEESKDALACSPQEMSLVEAAHTDQTCIVESMHHLNNFSDLQLIQLAHPSLGAGFQISTAQRMTEKELFHSSFLKSQASLIVAQDPMFHLRPELCKTLRSEGFENIRVLSYGVSALMRYDAEAVISNPESTSPHLIDASLLVKTVDFVPYVVVTDHLEVSAILSELEVQHLMLSGGGEFERQVLDVVALSENKPVLFINKTGGPKTSAWVANAGLNQLFFLEGGLGALLKTKGDIQRSNLSRRGVSQRVACAGA